MLKLAYIHTFWLVICILIRSGSSLSLWCGSGSWFLFDADPDPGSQNYAYPDPQHWSLVHIFIWIISHAKLWKKIQLFISKDKYFATTITWTELNNVRETFANKIVRYPFLQQNYKTSKHCGLMHKRIKFKWIFSPFLLQHRWQFSQRAWQKFINRMPRGKARVNKLVVRNVLLMNPW